MIVIISQLIIVAIERLPSDWFFFITSDAMENFICSGIASSFLFLFPRLKSNWKKLLYIILSTLILIVLSLVKYYRIYSESMFVSNPVSYLTYFIGLTFLFYTLLFCINRIENLISFIQAELELRKSKELLLRNQLQPHFLYNALNSLYSLSLKESSKTSEAILKLSGMMRFLTDDATKTQVKLSQEIKFIEEYINIEKIRFGDKSNIKFSYPKEMKEKDIAPLLLTVLVENAFKHGFYTNSKQAFIHINLTLIDSTLVFEVQNLKQNKKHIYQQVREGKGLENLKKRLDLTYTKKHEYQIEETENEYKAILKINLS